MLQQTTANNKLLCSIPAYVSTPGGLVIFARRKWGKAGYYGKPKQVRLNPSQLPLGAVELVGCGEINGVRIVPDEKIKPGQMRIE